MQQAFTNKATRYPIEIRPLSADEGGGWLASFPDLPGCLGDGATPEAAIADAYEAAAAWLAVAQEQGDAAAPSHSTKLRRIGAMVGQFKVPADFDVMGSEIIQNLFEGDAR